MSIALDARALAEARRLPGLLSRCDDQINQLPYLATPTTSDTIPIWHNGATYQIPLSLLGNTAQTSPTLRAVDVTAHTMTNIDAAFHFFPYASNFEVMVGDLFAATGQRLSISVRGLMTTTATPGNVDIQILIGSAIVADTLAVPLAASQTNAPFLFEVDCFVSAATAAVANVTQTASVVAIAAAASNARLLQLAPVVSGGVTANIPTNVALPITVQVAFSVNGQTITSQVATYSLTYPDAALLL